MTMSIDALTRRRRRRARREVAAEEARRRWEAVRAAVAEQADELADAAGDQLSQARSAAKPQMQRLRKQADVLADAAGEQLKEARDAAAPQVQRLRRELADASAEVSPHLARLFLDVKDATRGEAERIIEAINRSAEEALAEAHAEERRRRTWALLGWTAFGLAAGILLASEYGKRQRDEQSDSAPAPVERDVDLRDPEMRDPRMPAQDAGAPDIAAPVAEGEIPTVPPALRQM